jgi:hypothetical protein
MVDLALFVVDDIEALPLNGKVNLHGRAYLNSVSLFFVILSLRTMFFYP